MSGTGRRRRQFLSTAAAAGIGPPAWTQAQTARPGAVRTPTLVQFADMSSGQIDVSKDFLVGSRAAIQEFNARGGARGRTVQYQSVEVDGTPLALRAALSAARDNPACIGLLGTVGDSLAAQTVGLLASDATALAHIAPWLQNSSLDIDERTFPIFSARQEQIAHALKSLAQMGMQDVGAVFATPDERRINQGDLQRIAAELRIRLQFFGGTTDPGQTGSQMGAQTPAVLLFMGGTPELAQFTQGLERQARQRYVVAMADVNLQTLHQMGTGRSTPIIATQSVPIVTAGLPIVRAYREALARFFDEPPTALSLSGYVAARYALEIISDIDGVLSRASVLAAFQRRAPLDLGGYRVAFDTRRRSAGFVTQTLLTPDGRVVG